MPAPVSAEVVRTWTSFRSSDWSSRGRSATRSASSSVSRSAWLSTTGDRLVPGQRGHVAAVRGGVGVLLRVEHPHHQVGEPDQPVGLVSVAPGSSRGRAGRAGSARAAGLALVQRAGPGEAVAPLDAASRAAGRRRPAPRRRRAGRGRAAHAVGDKSTPEAVEQRRLAAARAAGERDHGVVGGQLEPVAGARQQLPRVGEQLLGLNPYGPTPRPQFPRSEPARRAG